MRFLKRFFNAGVNSAPNENVGSRMFGSTDSEIKELLIPCGMITVESDFFKIENYPFEPSIAYSQAIFTANQIDDIDFNSRPPTMRIGDELIFLTGEKKNEIEQFAKRNHIKTIQRPLIWGLILEPFLDTELSNAQNEKAINQLLTFGLTVQQIKELRNEVNDQMMKYNFDTMLWEWCEFDTLDVLKAMRPKYNTNQFHEFYNRTMKMALLTHVNK